MDLGDAQVEHPSIADRRSGPGRRYRIAIVSTGRFWVLDLARELHALGHTVTFYSLLPLSRARKFGLLPQCHRSLLLYLFPLVVAWRICPKSLTSLADRLLQRAVDFLAAIRLEPCDVFIGMSGLCVRSARAARDKYAAKIFIERGSRHILSQKEIGEAIAKRGDVAVSSFTVRRELWAYNYADLIGIPSYHVEESFLTRGIPKEKLFRNPYGVDLNIFLPTERLANQSTILFVGTWSLRKGCDLLWKACEPVDSWHVVHVGPLGDAPVPASPRFQHHDPVEQTNLIEFYQRAHIFVLASREEGLSLVLAQALACGLPVVCTTHTGGSDLREFLSDPKWVRLVPVGDIAALRDGMEVALALAQGQMGVRDILGSARDKFSWARYGKRYSDEIVSRLRKEDEAVG
jgi:glycosyltransferase involved in cell wall biosynthesis